MKITSQLVIGKDLYLQQVRFEIVDYSIITTGNKEYSLIIVNSTRIYNQYITGKGGLRKAGSKSVDFV